jgi:hypothetical protein
MLTKVIWGTIIKMTKVMLEQIFETARSDGRLAELLGIAREYAQIYVLARQRQKGCNGMGELVTLKEEFRDIVDKMIQYCKEKKYISEVISYDVDSIADGIMRL